MRRKKATSFEIEHRNRNRNHAETGWRVCVCGVCVSCVCVACVSGVVKNVRRCETCVLFHQLSLVVVGSASNTHGCFLFSFFLFFFCRTTNMVGATAAARKHKQEMAQKKRAHLETKRELEVRAKFREKEARASKRKQEIIKKKADDDLALERAAKSASDAAEIRASKERAEAEEKVGCACCTSTTLMKNTGSTFWEMF